MILIKTPGSGDLTQQLASQSRADGGRRNCVPNKDRADFQPVWESDHTMPTAQHQR
jgi:hypothetical protein